MIAVDFRNPGLVRREGRSVLSGEQRYAGNSLPQLSELPLYAHYPAHNRISGSSEATGSKNALIHKIPLPEGISRVSARGGILRRGIRSIPRCLRCLLTFARSRETGIRGREGCLGFSNNAFSLGASKAHYGTSKIV